MRELAKNLQQNGFSAGEIHGDMDQSSRNAELARFKAGTFSILVASDVAARGLDVKGVSHVFNFDTPWHPDDYVHRIGRTGRAGAKGRAFTLVAPEDAEAMDNVEKLTGGKISVFERGGQGGVAAPVAEPQAERPPREARAPRESRAPREERAPRTARPPREERPVADRPAREERVVADRPAAAVKPAPLPEPRPAPRPEPRPEPVVAQDSSDDGWNGPVPGFLGRSTAA